MNNDALRTMIERLLGALAADRAAEDAVIQAGDDDDIAWQAREETAAALILLEHEARALLAEHEETSA